MCGILGKIKFINKLDKREINLFGESLKLIKHRGPDAKGIYKQNNCILGHRRLSILDTNERSNQPLKHKQFIITFNGEIYNFKEIKKELIKKGHKFKTTSDTEVILHAYEEWESKCVNKFDGMWAFCIFNKKTNEYFISRDRIGEKPLVYYSDEEEFIFSSEIPSILKLLSKEKTKPNWKALANFNTYNFRHIPAPYTAYENILKLEPGYNIKIKNNKIIKEKYFSLKKEKTTKAIIKTTEVIQKAINQTKNSDVPIGIFLSGGVDSSLITAMMDKKITTYTLGYDKHDIEAIRAGKIAEKINVKNKQIYFKNSLEQTNILAEIRKIIKIYGEPINLYQIIYSNMILEEMKKDGIKVAIGGNGADEIFYGYDGANNLKIISKIKQIWDFLNLKKIIPNMNPIIKILNSDANQTKIELYKNAMQNKIFIKNKYRQFMYKKQFLEYSSEIKSTKILDKFNWLGLRIENEHSITNVADISGSINSMEIRTIFLNRIVLDLATNLPEKWKVPSFVNKKNNKKVLKKILEKKIGKELTYDKKRGFGYKFDLGNILKDNKKEIKRLIFEVGTNIPIYKEKELNKIYQSSKKGKNFEEIMEILIVCIWYEELGVK